ncbi:LOW QUALITY PROTEIN: P-selectin glycoprotein ligand 1 [Trachemys scripta elegans]|uniref:LOW QUALITY PROTEIN: P-selectin glycoprotein ligand 1 n=1 Tax=Trachemys scripta elegans TaxID=31138 RepID=UPI001555A53F|nr:LOW QUALITY PROTEIN: P-selectin glycoprotein ligand 1 [Trachemys scripta elegans]
MPAPILHCQPSLSQGQMAPIRASLLLLFSSLLQASAYKLPAIQLSGQDDRVRGGLPAAEGSQRGQWVWDTAGAGSADFPMSIREKREAEVKSSNHSAEETTNTTSHHNTFSTTPVDEAESSPAPELEDDSTSQENQYDDTTASAEPLSANSSDNVSTEVAKVTAGSHLDTSAKAAPTQGSSNVSSEAAVARIEEILVSSTESMEHVSSVRSMGVKGLGESSATSPPESRTESSDGVLLVKELASWRPGLSKVGKTHSSHEAHSGWLCRSASPLAGAARSHKYPGGEVFAGHLILALVAATFIICTAVLATLLWRQKRVCRVRRHNNTEMVCISALLPDSEPVANGEKPSKVKRMKMPTDNSSETEGDNLTVSSFLPDH